MRESNGFVYVWADKAMRRHRPPLVFRLVVMQATRHPVYFTTSVQCRSRRSENEVADLYRTRWGVEVFYWSFRQTFGRRKLKSHAAAPAIIELPLSNCNGRWLACGQLDSTPLTSRHQRRSHRHNSVWPARSTRFGQLPETACTLNDPPTASAIFFATLCSTNKYPPRQQSQPRLPLIEGKIPLQESPSSKTPPNHKSCSQNNSNPNTVNGVGSKPAGKYAYRSAHANRSPFRISTGSCLLAAA